MATKKATKATKKPNSKAPTAVKITDDTRITFKATRPKKGPKTALLALVPRKGSITVKQLAAKAEGEGIKSARVPQFVAALAKYGYVELG
jgi:hypothetical protein